MKNHFRVLKDHDSEAGNVEFQKHVISHFLALKGLKLDYYGADSGTHTFNIDGIIFKVEEDPDDGYRSHLGPVIYDDGGSGIFFKQPIATVQIIEYVEEEDFDITVHGELDYGYRLVDVDDGHVWLEFGTANYNDYFPYFMFRHRPKK
jgi:hypothetical protein